MSTHTPEADPPPNLPIIKAPPPQPPTHDSEFHRSIVPDGGDDGVEEGGFRTPTSIESRIPPALTCPPAPRKPRPTQKRSRAVLENERFEKIPRAEIEALFRSFEEFGAVVVFRAAAKRRCLCK